MVYWRRRRMTATRTRQSEVSVGATQGLQASNNQKPRGNLQEVRI